MSTVKQKSGAQKAAIRATSAIAMAAVCFVVFYLGHAAVCVGVIMLSTEIFRELLNVRYTANNKEIVGKIPRFRTIQWLWFVVALSFAYSSEFAKAPMGIVNGVLSSSRTSGLSTAAAFALYSFVFILTVVSMRGTNEELRWQITQLAWTLAAIALTVFQMKWVVFNSFQGLFWILFPALLVAVNDTGAYIAGKSFGRRCTHRTFFVLSPNKTWEGFLGAALFTAIAGFLAPLLLAKSGWLRCSFDELALSTGDDCPRTLLWTPSRTLTLGSTQLEIPTWLGDVAPIQFHGIAMALFASLVAPFGGLFASVVKRAYGLKDFDTLIPGHGGVMDRLDCQMIMCSFTFVYLTSFVLLESRGVCGGVHALVNAASGLGESERQLLLEALLDSSGAPQESVHAEL